MSVWDNAGEMLTRAQTARTQGDRNLAYQMFARASELNPQDASAWQGRAETATSNDEALVSYAYASALSTENQNLARTLDAAIAHRVADADKNDVALLIALGQELAEVGLMERAQKLLERATELDRSSTDAWVWLAGTSSENSQQLDYLHRALATNPRDSRARAGLLAVKPPAPAAPVSAPPTARAIARESNDLNAILAHATLTDDPREREQLYQRALQLDPDNAQARDGLSLLRVRKLRETARASEPAFETSPQAFRAALTTSDYRMRNIFLALLALVLLFAIAGIILLITQ